MTRPSRAARPLRPLGAAIARLLRGLGLETDIARADTTARWPAAAREILGAGAERTAAVGFDEGTLLVTVPDGSWSGEIRLRERELIAALGGSDSGISRIRSLVRADGGPATDP